MIQNDIITREVAVAITKQIRDAVDDILTAHGLTIAKSSTSFGDHYKFTITANAGIMNENGVNVASEYALIWLARCFLYDISREDAEKLLGATWVNRDTGITMKFLGMRSRGTRCAIVEKVGTGKTYAYEMDYILPRLRESVSA